MVVFVGVEGFSVKFRKVKMYYCNQCVFGWLKFGFKPRISVEQIVKDAYIDLCYPHFVAYMGTRFKYWLNHKSGFRLEELSKWWIR